MLTIRPRIAGDDARIVEIYNQQEGDSLPLTLARFREERAEKADPSQGEEWVALDDGDLVGAGSFGPAWWTCDPGIFTIEIRVDPARWREGIGTGLYDQLCSRLLSRGTTRLVGWIRADAGHAARFAARHGFHETGQVIQEYRLFLPDAVTGDPERAEERLRRDGLRLASLAKLGRDDEWFLRALQRVWAGGADGAPDPEELRRSFPTWQRQILHAPGMSPETHWVALDGDQPVGMTFLKRLSDEAAETDYTGVASTYRGRGIATALKRRALAWARETGLRWFFTSSEIGNARMIGINRRLGYQPGVRRIEVGREL